MAQICVNGVSECDGCGACFPEEGRHIADCECCGDAIHEGDGHYNIDGTLIHYDCLLEWAKQFYIND